MTRDTEIDLAQVVQILWGKIILIIILAISGGIIAGIITYSFIPPQYTAKVSMYVYNSQNRQQATLNDINMSVKLVGTYIVILKSETVLAEVASESNLNYTTLQLRDMISASSVDNTEVFEVKVTSENPDHARVIANTITKVAPKEIVRVVKAGSVEIIDQAQQYPPKTSPNNRMNILVGISLGLILSVGIIFINMTFDKTIKDEKELADVFRYPVLGAIPSIRKMKSEAYKYGR